MELGYYANENGFDGSNIVEGEALSAFEDERV